MDMYKGSNCDVFIISMLLLVFAVSAIITKDNLIIFPFYRGGIG